MRAILTVSEVVRIVDGDGSRDSTFTVESTSPTELVIAVIFAATALARMNELPVELRAAAEAFVEVASGEAQMPATLIHRGRGASS